MRCSPLFRFSSPSPAIAGNRADLAATWRLRALSRGREGYILVAPTYYVRGTIAEVYKRSHRMELCPSIPRTRLNYTRADWRELAEAYPVSATRRKSPRSRSSVSACALRIGKPLGPARPQRHADEGPLPGYRAEAGVELDIDGTLLLRCEP